MATTAARLRRGVVGVRRQRCRPGNPWTVVSWPGGGEEPDDRPLLHFRVVASRSAAAGCPRRELQDRRSLGIGACGSAPPARRASTAGEQRLRTARSSGGMPFLSGAFGSAPSSSRHATVARCAPGFQRAVPDGPPNGWSASGRNCVDDPPPRRRARPWAGIATATPGRGCRGRARWRGPRSWPLRAEPVGRRGAGSCPGPGRRPGGRRRRGAREWRTVPCTGPWRSSSEPATTTFRSA
jgi:hypothetical protein